MSTIEDFADFVANKGVILVPIQIEYANLHFQADDRKQYFNWGHGSGKTFLYSLIREFEKERNGTVD